MKVKVRDYVEREIDLELPVYRRQDLGDHDREAVVHDLVCLDERGEPVEVTVHLREMNVELEIEPYGFDSRSDKDYLAGRGRFAGTRRTFEQALERAEEMVRRARALFEASKP